MSWVSCNAKIHEGVIFSVEAMHFAEENFVFLVLCALSGSQDLNYPHFLSSSISKISFAYKPPNKATNVQHWVFNNVKGEEAENILEGSLPVPLISLD